MHVSGTHRVKVRWDGDELLILSLPVDRINDEQLTWHGVRIAYETTKAR